MIDVALGVRTAFFQALNNRIVFDGNPVPVGDDIKPGVSSSPVWIVLGSQTGTQRNTFNAWASDETIDIDIVYKTSTQSGKATLDNIAAQILAVIFPTRETTTLPAQAGMQFLNVVLSANRYISLALNASNTVTRRIMTMKLYVAQT